MDDNNPIIKALPPETDYITYLTIVEYNLTKERLPSLHAVLQNSDLTINIGWDLVHILLPLLPESKECLDDVARLGNPREVILKVTELLEDLGREEIDDEDESEDGQQDVLQDSATPENGQGTARSITVPSQSKSPRSFLSSALEFHHLISMLSTLHPRIKTKFPSRFLATSLQAILPAYIKTAQIHSSTLTLLNFIRTVAASTRPRLPPRAGTTALTVPEPAPDPEASMEPSGSDEAALQLRLLQSFLTHVVEGWVEGLEGRGAGEAGLGWAERFWERSRKDRVLKGRRRLEAAFAAEEQLRERDGVVGELAALARELKIAPKELLLVATRPEVVPSGDPDDLPSSPSEISLSHTGSLYLLAASLFQDASIEGPSVQKYWKILEQFTPFLGLVGNLAPGILPIVDAVLFLGLMSFHAVPVDFLSNPPSDEQADAYHLSQVQTLAEICATNPSQTLRSQTHNLISMILSKSQSLRKTFLVQILRDTPYISLRASAVTWLKESLLAAADTSETNPAALDGEKALLADAFPHLWPQPTHLLKAPTGALVHDIPFLLTAFNLYYLLYTNERLRAMFEMDALNEKWKFANTRLRPWEVHLKSAREVIAEEGEEGGDGVAVGWESTQLMLLDDVLGRVRGVLKGKEDR